jgi:hypothetical protein
MGFSFPPPPEQPIDYSRGLTLIKAINQKLKQMFMGPPAIPPVVRLQNQLRKQNPNRN